MSYTVLAGDCRKTLAALPDGAAQCCVTSPPYYGLRDYGHGDQIGLEQTPDDYVAGMVDVFRAVRRVLRDDGTLWLNLGDSYARNPAKGGRGPNGKHDNIPDYGNARKQMSAHRKGLADKQLLGIPWRVAFALQADGWFLRQDIIWHKPNPMPESVRDRCTKAHEYIFLLSKRPRYYYDHEAVKEPVAPSTKGRMAQDIGGQKGTTRAHGGVRADRPLKAVGDGVARNRRDVWVVTTKSYKGAHFATFPPDLIEPCFLAGCPPGGVVLDPFGGSGTVAGGGPRSTADTAFYVN